MQKTFNEKLKDKIEVQMNRPCKSHELVNMENDSLLMAQVIRDIVIDLEQRIIILEKKVK